MTTLIAPTTNTTLANYIYRVRRLLHDSTGQFYTDADLTDYINQARDRVARDTGCMRALSQGINITAGQEIYTTGGLANGPYAIDIMGVTLYYGTQRIKLQYMPWTKFDAMLRPWQTYQQRPVAFTRYAPGVIYLGPKPDINYTSDWDVIYTVAPMVNMTDTEVIAIPFQEPVQFFAAHLAKYYEQSFGESQVFEEQYKARLRNAMGTYMRRIIPDPYYPGSFT